MRPWFRKILLINAMMMAGCGGGSDAPSVAVLSAKAELGKKVFSDVTLSASGRMSCASCHDPLRGHAAPNGSAVQLGGSSLDQPGHRASPSIRYLSTNTEFSFNDEGKPTGGFFWDGRADSLQDQAGRPFLSDREMANLSKADVIAKLARAAYAAEFRAVFGDDIFSRPDDAFERMTLALQQFQLEDPAFRPFSSKYDDFLRGGASLTAQEQRGLSLFNDPAKGNCAACHPSAKKADGSHPLFTDFSYDNLGVPRNAELPSNADPAHFDLGLCSRQSGDLATRTDLCGAFKVPTLRNVATRQVFFHNGRFKSLKEALTFYVQRDTNPEKWYPINADGSIRKFDDLPERYVANVNTSEAPYDRGPDQQPALSDSEIDDVIEFLKTLTDGFRR